MTIHEVAVGDLVIEPLYGRIEDIWISNIGIWYAAINGLSIPLVFIKSSIPKQ